MTRIRWAINFLLRLNFIVLSSSVRLYTTMQPRQKSRICILNLRNLSQQSPFCLIRAYSSDRFHRFQTIACRFAGLFRSARSEAEHTPDVV